MKIILRQVHGLLDYVLGFLLMGAPWFLGFAGEGAATLVPIILGGGLLVSSLLTNSEVGLVHAIPFRVHLALDLLSGAFLAASPWIFGFASVVFLPHVIFGAAEIVSVLLTRETDNYVHHSHHHAHSH